MSTDTTTYHGPRPDLRHRRTGAGEARVAVFTRSYGTQQVNMGTGTILVCEAPRLLAADAHNRGDG